MPQTTKRMPLCRERGKGAMFSVRKKPSTLVMALLCMEPVLAKAGDTAPAAPPQPAATQSAPPTRASTGSAPRLPAFSVAPRTLWEAMRALDIASKYGNGGQVLDTTRMGPPNVQPARIPLGVLPGFTLPAATAAAASSTSAKPRTQGFLGSLGSWLAKLGKETGSEIKISGHSTFTLRDDNIRGGNQASSAFYSDEYFGRGGGGFYNDTDITIDATLFHALHYQTHISNYLYQSPDQNRVQIDYKTPSLHLLAGDINAGIHGNSLIDFNRYLNGVEITNDWSRLWHTTTLFSHNKATPRTLVIQGNNSSGPYYVYTGQIVQGSVQVRVDNKPMTLGKDYTLDTDTGELQFLNGLIIPSSSTIAVSYETLDYGQSSGSIYGFRLEYTPHSSDHVGFTYLAQLAPGSASLAQRTQQFYGNPTPLSPYVLDYPIDTSKPIIVKVNGVPQVQGVDFTIDPVYRNQIHLVAGVPTSEVVTIQYTPLNTNPIPSNQTVLGLDGGLGLGRLGSLTLETAMSGLTLSGQGVQGKAVQLRASLNPLRSLHTDITVRDIGATFSAIASPGFNRNEKSIEIASDYTPSSRLHMNFDWQTAKQPSYTSAIYQPGYSAILPTGNDNYHQFTGNINYNFARNGTLSLSHSTMSTLFAQGGSSSNRTDSLQMNYTLGTLGFQLGVSSNANQSQSLYSLLAATTSSSNSGQGTSTQLVNSSTNVLSENLGINWNPNHWFHLNTSLTNSQVSNQGLFAGNSVARNAQINATFNLHHGISLQYGYSLSDTGSINTSPTTSSSGTSSSGSSSGTATGVTSGGTTVSRGLLPLLVPARFLAANALMRDITTGGGSTTPTLGSGFTTGLPITSYLGGGYNSNLGSLGNYSGILTGGTLSAYNGIASLSGTSSTHHLTLSYNPNDRFHSSISFLTSSSIGSYLYNSNRTDTQLQLGWNLRGGLQVNLNYDMQNIGYTGGLGNSSINTLALDVAGKLFRKLNFRLDALLLSNKSLLNASSLTTTSGSGSTTNSLTNTSSNTVSYLLHLDYPLNAKIGLFFDYSDSLTAGYLGNNQLNLRFGLDYYIARPMKFSLGWQILSTTNSDPSLSGYNYHVSSLIAQLGFEF
ncbi:hypothetical protein CTKA_02330 [Chthonomonas calidirosea]|uniref:Uncharacterized protein n=2 Tax=Chthonomonas TaxID=1077265 RepID=S0EVV5_CHTCT|nr:hypothetical protein CCALI_01764 [Chthonomonas calidirosea T49]CEK19856.1 hypothetical protein CTKA_02330 [Chthonomonas calidirosea]